MKLLPVLPVVLSLTLSAAATAQGCVALAGGQPCLAAVAPICRNAVPAAVVQVFGNPAFALHCPVTPPAAPVGFPAGMPMVLLVGVPTPVPIPLGAPPLTAACGVPGGLAMQRIVLALPAYVSGTLGVPAIPFPIPAGLGPLGLAVSTQIAVGLPAGVALSAATGIVI